MTDKDEICSTSLNDSLQIAIAEALEMCDRLSADAKKCAAAWESIKALQEEGTASFSNALPKTAFEAYCEAHPNAIECQFREED